MLKLVPLGRPSSSWRTASQEKGAHVVSSSTRLDGMARVSDAFFIGRHCIVHPFLLHRLQGIDGQQSSQRSCGVFCRLRHSNLYTSAPEPCKTLQRKFFPSSYTMSCTDNVSAQRTRCHLSPRSGSAACGSLSRETCVSGLWHRFCLRGERYRPMAFVVYQQRREQDAGESYYVNRDRGGGAQ